MTVLGVALLSFRVLATPQIIRVDGSIFDSAGAPMTSNKDIQIKAYDAATGGTLLWTSDVYNSAITSGRFTANMDAASGSTPSLVTQIGARTAAQGIYLQVEVDSGAANGSMDSAQVVKPRIRAKGTMFALGAATSDGISGVTATVAEFNRLAGVTANIQSQLNSTVNAVLKTGGTMTGKLGLNYSGANTDTALVLNSNREVVSSSVTATELSYLSGAASSLQTQINGKASTSSVIAKTGDTMTGDLGLAGSQATPDRALLLDSSRRVSSSSVTGTELGYLSGVTSLLQTQLNAKAATSSVIAKGGDTMTGKLGLSYSGANVDTVLTLNSNREIVSSLVSALELAYLQGVTAGVQSQLETAKKYLGQACSAGQYLSGFDPSGNKVCASLPGGNSDSLSYTQVAMSTYLTCAILSDQNVQCWGTDSYGATGNGTTAGTANPKPAKVYKVDGTLLKATKVVAAGYYSACAIQASDSKVYCWGYNPDGRLGNGTTNDSALAFPVSTLGAVSDVSGALQVFCAVDAAGKVWCWGYNDANGYLGDGTFTQRTTPVAVVTSSGQLSSMTNVVGGGAGHSCAYSTNDGTPSMYCWGYNGGGTLGDGTTTSQSTATPVIMTAMTNAGTTNIVSMSAGGDSYYQNQGAGTCAVVKVATLTGVSTTTSVTASGNGTSWTNTSNATTSNNSYATAALTSATVSVNLVATGFGFSIPTDATVRGIQVEWEKKVSAGTTAFDNSIRVVKGGSIGATDKSSATAWATSDTWESYGGGSELWGESWTPSDINSSNFGVALSARNTSGTSRTFSVDSVRIRIFYTNPANPFAYKAYCWGLNSYGELMDGTTTASATPVYASLIGSQSSPFVIARHSYSACYMPSAGGIVKCMGYNGYGQLGNGTTSDSTSSFVNVLPIGASSGTISATALGINAGGYQNSTHQCAVTSTGALACWGHNNYGQLGNGSTANSSVPVGVIH